MDGLTLLYIVIVILSGVVIWLFAIDTWNDINWKLEKYGKHAKVPYCIKRQYIMNCRRDRQKHAKERHVILRRLYNSINKDDS